MTGDSEVLLVGEFMLVFVLLAVVLLVVCTERKWQSLLLMLDQQHCERIGSRSEHQAQRDLDKITGVSLLTSCL